ncbi:MAG: septum formation protein Maf [Bacteroidales bacterium]|nr:septum formation protein Maf [Bacteroidales bacterium]MBR4690683.1 septum formation protein Maf [Bacteroidales bacterium]
MHSLARKLQNFNVILGSASPRRKELLAGLDIPFEIRVKNTTEVVDSSLPFHEIPQSIAEQKFAAFDDLSDKDFLITADTLVFCDGKAVGKPKSKDDAKQMIRFLSGKTHTVITGVCFGTKKSYHTFRCETQVTFATISDDDIDYYVETYCPLDKAGAYGVQEWIGYISIERIEGSYYNVMGLPVHKLFKEILACNAL